MTILLALLLLQASPTRIVLIAGEVTQGKGDHEWAAGSRLLAAQLSQTVGVEPTVVTGGWPPDEQVLDGARALVFYMDGGGKQPFLGTERLARLEGLAARGIGLVHLHQVIDYPKAEGERVLPLLGGVYVPKVSLRGHWDAEFKDFVEHPITRGVAPFAENDGFLYGLRFVDGLKGITPLLRAWPPKGKPRSETADVVAWAYERPAGGRSFVFTGGHAHKEWALEGLRRFTVNGILWAAGLEIPDGGAPAALDPALLELPKRP
jgi:hypothetical protein